ncbi:hypothetical protein Taro_021344 [Colocasia esculenta]|uniref:Uncharacterized protein n=1 Tax=Colocasia esculenta TaxID=4460 RepID=A0A843V119_COLES|nr:hypothetical protein [Colocasia esculenta]
MVYDLYFQVYTNLSQWCRHSPPVCRHYLPVMSTQCPVVSTLNHCPRSPV